MKTIFPRLLEGAMKSVLSQLPKEKIVHNTLVRASTGLLFGLAVDELFRPGLVQQISTPVIFAAMNVLIGSISLLLFVYFVSFTFLAILFGLLGSLVTSSVLPSPIFQILTLVSTVLIMLLKSKDTHVFLNLKQNYFELFATVFSLALAIKYSSNLYVVGKTASSQFLLGAEDNDAWLYNIAHLQTNGIASLNHAVNFSMGNEIPSFFLSSSFFSSALQVHSFNLLLSAQLLISSVGFLIISVPIVTTLLIKELKEWWKIFPVWILSSALILEFGISLSGYGSIDSFLGLFLMLLVISTYTWIHNDSLWKSSAHLLFLIILTCGASSSWPPLFPIAFCMSAYFLLKIFRQKHKISFLLGFLVIAETTWSWTGFLRAGVSNLLLVTGGTNQISFKLFVLLAVFTLAYLAFVTSIYKFDFSKYRFPANIVIFISGYVISIFLYCKFILNAPSTYSLVKLIFVLSPILLIALVIFFVQNLESWVTVISLVIFSFALSPFSSLQTDLLSSPKLPNAVPLWYPVVQKNIAIHGNERNIICLSVASLQDWSSDMESYFCNRFAASEQGLDDSYLASWRFLAIGRVPVSESSNVLSGLSHGRPIVLVLGGKNSLNQNNSWYQSSYIKLKSLNSEFIFVNKK